MIDEIRSIPGNAPALEHLVNLLQSKKAVAFVGAGASADLYPTWDRLIARLADAAGEYGAKEEEIRYWKSGKGDPLDKVEMIFGFIRESFWGLLEKEFGFRCKEGKSYTRVHEFLLRLPFCGYVTTNYDLCLSRARSEVRRVHDPIPFTWKSDQVARWEELTCCDRPPIVHAHGMIEEPSSLVLGKSWYRSAYERGPWKSCFDGLWKSKGLVFVGFSFEDPWIRFLGDLAVTKTGLRGTTSPRHVAIIGIDQAEMKVPHLKRREIEDNFHARVLFYPVKTGDHRALSSLFEFVRKRVPSPIIPASEWNESGISEHTMASESSSTTVSSDRVRTTGHDDSYSKTIRVVHMSGSLLNSRPLSWIKQLRSISDQRLGFDYILVSGEIPALHESTDLKLTEELKALLRIEDGFVNRILLLPSGERATRWSSEVRPLQDVTVVALSGPLLNSQKSLKGLVTELQRVSELTETLEYNTSTPTLLVTTTPLILPCGPTNAEITEQIRHQLTRLGVTLNLYDRGPAICIAPDPFGSPNFSLGSGLLAKNSRLQANAVSIHMDFERDDSDLYRNKHSVDIRAFRWLPDGEQFKPAPKPFISGELDDLLHKLRATEEGECDGATHDFYDEFTEIVSLLKKGKRAIGIRGLPGVGKHAFWQELKDAGLKGCKLVPLQLADSAGKDLDLKLPQCETDIKAAQETAGVQYILIAVFDSVTRDHGDRADSNLGQRDKVFELFQKWLSQDHRTVILYLPRRVEDHDLRDYNPEIKEWNYIEMGPTPDGTMEQMRRRYSFTTPLDGDVLRIETGNFFGLYREVLTQATRVFRRQLLDQGHQKVSLKYARAVIEDAVKTNGVRAFVGDFLSGLGVYTRASELMFEWIRILGTGKGREITNEPERTHRFRYGEFYEFAEEIDPTRLQRLKIEGQIKSIVNRLARSKLLAEDPRGDGFVVEPMPAIPFRLFPMLDDYDSWRPLQSRSLNIVFPPEHRELAVELQLMTAKRALVAGFRCSFDFNQRNRTPTSWAGHQKSQNDGLVVITDSSWSAEATTTLRDWNRHLPLIEVVVEQESYRTGSPEQSFWQRVSTSGDIASQRPTAELIVSMLSTAPDSKSGVSS